MASLTIAGMRTNKTEITNGLMRKYRKLNQHGRLIDDFSSFTTQINDISLYIISLMRHSLTTQSYRKRFKIPTERRQSLSEKVLIRKLNSY